MVTVTVMVMKLDPVKLREAAEKHLVSRSTILSALAGHPVRGRAVRIRCDAALKDLGVSVTTKVPEKRGEKRG